MVRLTINGKTQEVDVDPSTPLLWVLREQVGLTGTKYGCGMAQCGACTVHINGAPTRSCVMPVSAAVGKRITTIEGLASGKTLTKVQQAWVDLEVPQCGFCQNGQIMTAKALLDRTPNPTDQQIRETMSRTLCRCMTYYRVQAAIKLASRTMRAGIETTKKEVLA